MKAVLATLLIAAVYGTPEEQAICLPDIKRLCPHLTIESSHEELVLCIRTNRNRFSRPCSAVLRNNGY